MSKRTQQIVLGLLAAVLAVTLFFTFSGPRSAVLSGFNTVNTKFEPLKVEDPQLRMDLLEKVRKADYKGDHHDIFSYGPPQPTPAQQKAAEARAEVRPFVGPQKPPPPVPPTVPATYFGFATNPTTQTRLAFFSREDEVIILGEGGMLMNRFRLIKIGNNSAEFEEAATGMHATLVMTQPEGGAAAGAAAQMQGPGGPGMQQPQMQ